MLQAQAEASSLGQLQLRVQFACTFQQELVASFRTVHSCAPAKPIPSIAEIKSNATRVGAPSTHPVSTLCETAPSMARSGRVKSLESDKGSDARPSGRTERG
jgi:hypothetical protein